jgi:anti-sigma regulatory factor (Ser/Thr protein kinase)
MPHLAELRLAGEPQSAGAARRFVVDALEKWGCPEYADDAALATSELVTNAALHTGTEITMRVSLTDDGVRVEVHDDGVVVLDEHMVGQPPPSADATTGRGFQVVSALASRWGVLAEAVGKTAWFELAPGDSDAAGATMAGTTAPVAAAEPGSARVVLHDVPVALALAFDLHLSGLVREAQLATATAVDGQRVARRLRVILEAYSATLAMGVVTARAASARGETTVTIDYDVPLEVLADGDRVLRLLDTADELCRQGVLLSLPASTEVRGYRTWCLEETIRQAQGEPARTYPRPA